MYYISELETLCEYYFGTDDGNRNEFTNEWGSFKFELVSMGKKRF